MIFRLIATSLLWLADLAQHHIAAADAGDQDAIARSECDVRIASVVLPNHSYIALTEYVALVSNVIVYVPPLSPAA